MSDQGWPWGEGHAPSPHANDGGFVIIDEGGHHEPLPVQNAQQGMDHYDFEVYDADAVSPGGQQMPEDPQLEGFTGSTSTIHGLESHLGEAARQIYSKVRHELQIQVPSLDPNGTPEYANRVFIAKAAPLAAGASAACEFVAKLARAFNRIADAGMIGYGVLGPLQRIPIPAGLDWSGGVGKPQPANTVMLCLYTYSEFDFEALNGWLGTDLFAEEGGTCGQDWSRLP